MCCEAVILAVVASFPGPPQLFNVACRKDQGAWGRGYGICYLLQSTEYIRGRVLGLSVVQMLDVIYQSIPSDIP